MLMKKYFRYSETIEMQEESGDQPIQLGFSEPITDETHYNLVA
jgi:hypothetical protein